jgi:hypothetical protein
MTDSEMPGFKVVDRRRAAPEGANAPSGETTVEMPGSAPAVPQDIPRTDMEEPNEAGNAAVSDAESADGVEAERGLPDPAMLVSFAAMQMDVRSLMRMLTAVFDGQAWRALGLVADPSTGDVKKDLPSAQLAIDVVQFLIGKLESDLSDGERRELLRRLSDLRMNYLAKLREG